MTGKRIPLAVSEAMSRPLRDSSQPFGNHCVAGICDLVGAKVIKQRLFESNAIIAIRQSGNDAATRPARAVLLRLVAYVVAIGAMTHEISRSPVQCTKLRHRA